MLLRDHVDAAEALRLGVVTEVVPPGEALTRALELAEALAGRPPLAVEIARRAADAAAESSRDALLLVERLAYGGAGRHRGRRRGRAGVRGEARAPLHGRRASLRGR